MVQLWLHNRKREQIRFAKEMGRSICHCTETGEIMLKEKEGSTLSAWWYKCPQCNSRKWLKAP
jgi:hypothetical protein